MKTFVLSGLETISDDRYWTKIGEFTAVDAAKAVERCDANLDHEGPGIAGEGTAYYLKPRNGFRDVARFLLGGNPRARNAKGHAPSIDRMTRFKLVEAAK